MKLNKHAKNKEDHLNCIIKSINQMTPDIISMCELSNKDELDYIKYKLNNNDKKYFSYFIKSNDTHTEQNNSLISLVEPTITPHTFSNKISKHYTTTFDFQKVKLSLVSCHLLAFPNKIERIKQREDQAKILSCHVNNLVKNNHEVILAGDLNDTDNDVQDTNMSKSMSNVLDIIKGNILTNTNNKIKQCNRYTYIHNNKKIMLDHVLVTTKLYNSIKKVSIKHIKNKSQDDSDHDPIMVDFNIKNLNIEIIKTLKKTGRMLW